MRYALILAAAAFAHAHEHQHGRFHARRRVETTVEVDVVTVTEWVTAGATSSASVKEDHFHSGSYQPYSSSSAAASSASEVSSAASTSSSAEVSSVSAASTSSAATSFATSASSYSSPSAYSTSSAAATSSSVTSASSSAAASSTGISLSNLSPYGKKAGLSGYPNINYTLDFDGLAQYISWYSDYTPNPPSITNYTDTIMPIGMLWGADGSACSDTTPDRLDAFNSLVSTETSVPNIMFGFYEPDCSCDMSSEMSTSDAASDWDSLIAPLGEKGTILGSPSMCKQKDEDFLTPFNSSISRTWDVTSIHINKPDLAGAQADVEYYVSTYGKPVWVSEFACVDDVDGFVACTDQDIIDDFINQVVPYFENNPNVVAYGASNGEGLLDVWPLFDKATGTLSKTGQTYMNAISGY